MNYEDAKKRGEACQRWLDQSETAPYIDTWTYVEAIDKRITDGVLFIPVVYVGLSTQGDDLPEGVASAMLHSLIALCEGHLDYQIVKVVAVFGNRLAHEAEDFNHVER